MNLSETAFVLEKNDQDTYDKGQNISASVFFYTHLSLRSRYKFSIRVVLFFSTSLQLEAYWEWLSGTNAEMSTSRDLKSRASLCCIPPFPCGRFEWPKPPPITYMQVVVEEGGLLQGGAIAPQTKIRGARAPLHFGAQKHFYGCIIWHYLWHRWLQSAHFLPSDSPRTTYM